MKSSEDTVDLGSRGSAKADIGHSHVERSEIRSTMRPQAVSLST